MFSCALPTCESSIIFHTRDTSEVAMQNFAVIINSRFICDEIDSTAWAVRSGKGFTSFAAIVTTESVALFLHTS